MIKVAVFGAQGQMGQRIVEAVKDAEGLELIAAIDAADEREQAEKADVAIDFTHPDAVMDTIRWCIDHGIHMVVGTTGFNEERYEQVRSWLNDHPQVNILIASNFSIAAVLMMNFAAKAAPFFESVEIVELHHPRKADAPSGTATQTAQRIAASRQLSGQGSMPDATTSALEGARGANVDDVRVHSVRLSGLFAHQEVLLGNPGEMLTIRDDSYDRSSYMPGIIAAVKAVGQRPGLTIGIDEILGVK